MHTKSNYRFLPVDILQFLFKFDNFLLFLFWSSFFFFLMESDSAGNYEFIRQLAGNTSIHTWNFHDFPFLSPANLKKKKNYIWLKVDIFWIRTGTWIVVKLGQHFG